MLFARIKRKKYSIVTGSLWVAFFFMLSMFEQDNLFKEKLDQYLYDFQVGLSARKNPPANIIIVDIDEKSIQSEGHWPWSRAKLANLLEILGKNGVVVIAADMIFSEKQDNPISVVKQDLNLPPAIIEKLEHSYDQDLYFTHAIKGTDTILGFVLHHEKEIQVGTLPKPLTSTTCSEYPGIFELEGYTANLASFQQEAKNGGFVTTFRDSDGVVRRVPLILCHQGKLYPSLSLAAVKQYLLSDKIEIQTETIGSRIVMSRLLLDTLSIPTDEHGQVLVTFLGRAKTFRYISATDILHQNVDLNVLEGAIVFIGASAFGLSDLQIVPKDSTFPGVEVHANVAASILNQTLRQLPAWHLGAEVCSIMLIGITAVFIFPFLPPIFLVVGLSFLMVAIFGFNYYLFNEKNLVISFSYLYCLVVMLMFHYLFIGFFYERRSKKEIQGLFGQYVPPLHVKKMSEDPGRYGFGGETKELTILFSDIRNFTHFSESLEADKVKHFLNEYFTPMTKIIFDTGGTIDKYIGDMIMAFWGAPLDDPLQKKHAIEAALNMRAFSKKFLENVNDSSLGLGIGINTGLVHVGDMGSEFRRSYTVLGDTVNLASRLESATKFYQVSNILAESTIQGQTNYLFRPLDRVKVKGKERAVNIYEVIGRNAEVSAQQIDEIKLFKSALEKFYQQDWSEAKKMLTELALAYPDCKLYTLFLSRLAVLKNLPYDSEWDGVFELGSK